MVAGLSGRVALPSAYAGARRARVPFVLWATIWAHPRTAAHALSYLPLRHLYRHADAIVTYGPHVSAYVRSKGARQTVVEAPQSRRQRVLERTRRPRFGALPFQAAFVGPNRRGKKDLKCSYRPGGPRACRHSAPRWFWSAAVRSEPGPSPPARSCPKGRAAPAEVRNFYAGSDVVVLPSVPTRDFREPWGLVVNEAFNQGVPVIATDAVGAVAGGLVRHERTGLVVPAGDVDALAAALRRMHGEPALRARLGAAAREAVKAYTHDAWAAGVSSALAAVGASRC